LIDLEVSFEHQPFRQNRTFQHTNKMISKIQAAAILGSLAASVSAHGHLSAIKVDGKDFTAYDPSFQYQSPPPEVIEWSCPECQDNGFVDPSMYDDATKIACHKDATAGAKVAEVAAGGKLDISWTTWPESHVGPVIDYLAKVDDATAAKSTDLEFFKIDAAGFSDGKWASDKLIANNNTWSVTIPDSSPSRDHRSPLRWTGERCPELPQVHQLEGHRIRYRYPRWYSCQQALHCHRPRYQGQRLRW
jgi:hypothetical protein